MSYCSSASQRHRFGGYSQEQLDAVADQLSACLRMTVGLRKAFEVYAEHLACLALQPDSIY